MMKTFDIVGCEKFTDISQKQEYKKLMLTDEQKIQISGLLQQFPTLLATEKLSDAYIVHFPNGVDGHLMNYAKGGVGTPIQDNTGNIIAHASLEKNNAGLIAIAQGFAVMSIITSQYFLTEISHQLKELSKSIDKILEFLYGDKKAELIAEVSFTKYAYENYASIMACNEQRTATISSLQAARKVAMKDIEFYMSDLNDTVSETSDLQECVDKAFRIKSCLELSMQLHVMSNLLEIYYSQNFENTHIQWIENNVVEYLIKCEKRMLSGFSKLSASIHDFKNGPLKKIDKIALGDVVNDVIDSFGSGRESDMHKQFLSALHSMDKDMKCYIDKDANVYLKTS